LGIHRRAAWVHGEEAWTSRQVAGAPEVPKQGMSRPVGATAVVAGIVAAVAVGARLGLGMSINSLGLALAGVCFAAGANARRSAAVPVRLLDGAATVVGAQTVAWFAAGTGPVSATGVLAFAVALGAASWLHGCRGAQDPD
jgi:hypothetical protein